MDNCKTWTSDKFFERLDFFLSIKKWSFYQLCSAADISVDTLYKMRHRNTLPSLQTVCIICDAIDLSISQFFAVENSNPDCALIVNQLDRVSAESLSVLADLVKCLK